MKIVMAFTLSAALAAFSTIAHAAQIKTPAVSTPQLKIGSQASGAGAGKVKFNEFQVHRTTDRASPSLFQHVVNGKHFNQGTITIR